MSRRWRTLAGIVRRDMARLIPDVAVRKTRLDKKTPTISVLTAIVVRRDGQTVLRRSKTQNCLPLCQTMPMVRRAP